MYGTTIAVSIHLDDDAAVAHLDPDSGHAWVRIGRIDVHIGSRSNAERLAQALLDAAALLDPDAPSHVTRVSGRMEAPVDVGSRLQPYVGVDAFTMRGAS